MKLKTTVFSLLAAVLCVAAVSCAHGGAAHASNAPKTYLWNGDRIAAVKKELSSNPVYADAYASLVRRADRSLAMENPSVMDKEHIPASGDKHDYMSMARYFWPDPNSPNGLPYITRDGRSNPELEQYDRNRLGAMASAVTNLSMAFYLSGEQKYADKAVSMIRTWFLDPATRMNPNMNYAQMVPGLYDGMGRSYGIIDGYSFVSMLDGVMLLKAEEAIPEEDFDALRDWFAEYSTWFVESDHGKAESRVPNNHSIAYDVQLLMYSLFGEEKEIAHRVISEFPARRLEAQIRPDGSQPHELTRTIAYWYSTYNLAHILDVCDMARGEGMDLYHTAGADGSGSIDKSIEFLTPYIGKPDEWPYEQIHDWDGAERLLVQCLFRASKYNSESNYLEIYNANSAEAGRDGMFVLLNM